MSLLFVFIGYLAQILAMGLILGLVREHVNTTTAIAVHASYNFLVFLLGI